MERPSAFRPCPAEPTLDSHVKWQAPDTQPACLTSHLEVTLALMRPKPFGDVCIINRHACNVIAYYSTNPRADNSSFERGDRAGHSGWKSPGLITSLSLIGGDERRFIDQGLQLVLDGLGNRPRKTRHSFKFLQASRLYRLYGPECLEKDLSTCRADPGDALEP